MFKKISNLIRLYQILSQKSHTCEKFTVVNNNSKQSDAILWGGYHYYNSVNYGSDIGVQIIPFHVNHRIELFMSEVLNAPYIFKLIHFETKGRCEIEFQAESFDGIMLSQKIKFEDELFVYPEMLKFNQLKMINGRTTWKINMSAEQKIEITMSGKRLKWM